MTHDAGRSDPLTGEVREISWGDKGSSSLCIPAAEVTQPGTWYAAYSWDGDDKELKLSKPTQQQPAQPKPAPSASGAPSSTVDIEKLSIDSWGTAKLDTPLEWSGKTNGVATILFTQFADISGPIGHVVG